jgi:DNA-binding transcriptional LysR family regulator
LLAVHPRIHVRVQVTRFGHVTDAVAAGDLDVGLAELHDAEERSELETEPVVTRPLSFFCRPDHELADRDDLAVDDLMAYPWATTRAPRRMNGFIPRDTGRAGFWDDGTGEFVPAIETDTMAGVAELASISDALMVGTATVAESELASGRLRRVRYEAPWLRFNYGFISRRHRTLPPLAEEFKRLVRDIETELDARETELLRAHA